MKTTTPRTIGTILFFPPALALAGLTGCAAAPDGSDPENGSAADVAESAPAATDREASMRPRRAFPEDQAPSHVGGDAPGTSSGGPPHEGPTTIGRPHRQE
jgi:hypothetical protein